uniref:Uncharacterized protein n=1 Tax=Panagrolaimus sp. JU765 TaxID=591449 RepID=A0AC34R3P5_9BILA
MPPFIRRGRRRKDYLPSTYPSGAVSEPVSSGEQVEVEKKASSVCLTTNLKPDVVQAMNRVEPDISEQFQSLFAKEHDLDAVINRKILSLSNPSLSRPILCGLDLRFMLMYTCGPSDYNSSCHGLPYSVEMKFLCSGFNDQLKDSNLVSPICGSRMTPFEKFLTIVDSIRIDFDT